jgi:hypothetical protein
MGNVSWQPKLYPGLYAESLAEQTELFSVRDDDVKPAPPEHICDGLFVDVVCPACASGLDKPRREENNTTFARGGIDRELS